MSEPLTLTRYWVSLTCTGVATLTPLVSALPLRCTAKLLASTLAACMPSLKVTKKSTVSALVCPPEVTLVPRTTLATCGATVSTRNCGDAPAAPALPAASV